MDGPTCFDPDSGPAHWPPAEVKQATVSRKWTIRRTRRERPKWPHRSSFCEICATIKQTPSLQSRVLKETEKCRDTWDCSHLLVTRPAGFTRVKIMQSIRNSILSYMRVRVPMKEWLLAEEMNAHIKPSRQLCTLMDTRHAQIMARVISLVKKFDKIDTTKVTETADFQRDLCLDSLDRVELVMAFEQEFSIEIPDEKADKLTCCADVAKYIISETEQRTLENSWLDS